MALAHAIMTALIEDDLSGYELARDFETSLGFFLAFQGLTTIIFFSALMSILYSPNQFTSVILPYLSLPPWYRLVLSPNSS